MQKEVAMSKEHRDSFIFYRSFQEGINELSEVEQLIIYRSIASYALNRQEPELEGTTKLVWLLIKPQIDANWRRYNNGCRGGAPVGNTNAVKTTKRQPKSTEKQTNINKNHNLKENENISEWFIPPTLSDIEGYVSEGRLSVSAENFYDYYTSNGWMMGKNPMVDWRAALRNWSRKTEQGNSNQQRTLSNDL